MTTAAVNPDHTPDASAPDDAGAEQPAAKKKRVPPEYAKRMPIHDIRQRNYLALRARLREIENYAYSEHGSLARFAARCDISPHYLTHVNVLRKVIGSACAAKMEEGFGLPKGWMDVDHAAGAVVMDPQARDFAALAMRLYLRDPEGVRAALTDYMEKKLG